MIKKSAIVISASSDIGMALCRAWSLAGWKVAGTFRTTSSSVENLRNQYNVEMVHCDLLDVSSCRKACEALQQTISPWDVMVFAPGIMEPIGNFEELDFDAWENAFHVNMLRPLRILHELLPFRKKGGDRPVGLFFAGAGTNNAALNYSAYALSKVALIKMCDLLDAEVPDMRFVIVGPGWVKTKIHESTLVAGEEQAGSNYQRTIERFEANQWVPMEKVVECCSWLISSPSKGIGGRNFSVPFDRWGAPELEQALEEDPDMYKLRRHKNDWR